MQKSFFQIVVSYIIQTYVFRTHGLQHNVYMLNVSTFLSQASRAFTAAPQTTQKSAVNPFMNYNGNTLAAYKPATYARNLPVSGGYFAGYYNGKQNIVGTRLFVEV